MKMIVNNKESYYTAFSEVQKQVKEHGAVTIEISPNVKRSTAQNSYAFALYKIMGDHIGMSVDMMHAWAKLKIGISYLYSEECNKKGIEQREKFERYLRNQEYEYQMQFIIDNHFQVTSAFTVNQMRLFLDELTQRVIDQGIKIPSKIDYGLNDEWELVK